MPPRRVENFDKDEFGDQVGHSEEGNHHTVFDKDRQSHMSWDTNKNGDYVDGSGHEQDDETGETQNWNLSGIDR